MKSLLIGLTIALLLGGCATTYRLQAGDSIVVRELWTGDLRCVGAETNCAMRRMGR